MNKNFIREIDYLLIVNVMFDTSTEFEIRIKLNIIFEMHANISPKYRIKHID